MEILIFSITWRRNGVDVAQPVYEFGALVQIHKTFHRVHAESRIRRDWFVVRFELRAVFISNNIS